MGFEKEEMTGHGFRAMARTILDEVLQFRVDFIEHCWHMRSVIRTVALTTGRHTWPNVGNDANMGRLSGWSEDRRKGDPLAEECGKRRSCCLIQGYQKHAKSKSEKNLIILGQVRSLAKGLRIVVISRTSF